MSFCGESAWSFIKSASALAFVSNRSVALVAFSRQILSTKAGTVFRIRLRIGQPSSIALKAELELAGPNGRRRVAAQDFFVDIMTTALETEEVLVAVHVARPKPGVQFRYRKIRHPASGYAVVGVAVALRLQDGVVTEATIGITGATGRAFAADPASPHLIGKPLSSQNIATVALLASEQAEFLSDGYASADYRKHLVKTEVTRALTSLSDAQSACL